MINPYNRHLPADGEPSWSLLLSSVSLLLLQPEITKKDRIQGYKPTLNTFTTCVYLPKYVRTYLSFSQTNRKDGARDCSI